MSAMASEAPVRAPCSAYLAPPWMMPWDFTLPLAAALRLKERLLGGSPGGTAVPPAPVNSVFRRIFGSERHLLRGVNLPFGVSLVAILSPT